MISIKKYQAYIELIRPLNLLITFITVIVASIICSPGNMNLSPVLLAALAAALTAAAGNVINDYFDVGIDKINRPDRPLPSRKISLKSASIFYLSLVILSLAMASLVSLYAFLVVLLANNLLFLYSYNLKRILLLGNVVVSFLTGFTFIYGGIVVANPKAAVIPAVFAFLINMIREIVKDMEDIKGDKAVGVITFPGKFGTGVAKILLAIIIGLLILFTVYPYYFHIYNLEFLLIVLFSVNLILVYILRLLFIDDSPGSLRKVSNLLKAGMVFGLIAIYFGT
jgi:geranylgeranylglycerol-phosphate geranylgeranyltransferase